MLIAYYISYHSRMILNKFGMSRKNFTTEEKCVVTQLRTIKMLVSGKDNLMLRPKV